MLKKFISITVGVLLVFILSSCSIKSPDDRIIQSSYDGYYFSFDSIIENKDDILFTIKDGKLQSEILQSEIDESRKKISSEKESYKFIYSKGEMTILDKKEKVLLTGYRKNTLSYTSVDEIYGKYERVVVPNLKKIIETNVNELVSGKYISEDTGLEVKKIIIKEKGLQADFIGEEITAKNEKLVLKKVQIEPPLWDDDLNSDINRSIVNQYSKLDDLEKVIKNIDFSLTFNINGLEKEYMIINFNKYQENYNQIEIKSRSILGDVIIDDTYAK